MLQVLMVGILAMADAGFTAVSPMLNSRVRGQTTLMNDGRVLACGSPGVATCDIYNPDTNEWSMGPLMKSSHSLIGSTRTVNAEPLLVDSSGPAGEEVLVGSTWVARAVGPQVDYSPVLNLQNGEIMIASGNRTPSNSQAVWVRATDGTWQSLGNNFAVGFNSHTLSELPSGNLLLVRAGGNSDRALPDGGAFVPMTPTALGKSEHTATVLYDSSVLVCGPQCERTVNEGATWTSLSWPTTYLTNHSATLMPDGSLWVMGGLDGTANSVGATYLFSLATGWLRGPDLVNPRSDHHTVLLPTGRVLVVGGVNASTVAEMADRLEPTRINGPALPFVPGDATVAWLYSGNSLIVGLPNGQDTWLWKAGAWVQGPTMPQARTQPSAVVLRDGRVLVSGGGPLDSLLFDESSNSFTIAGDMPESRVGAEARLLTNGTVLVTGGRTAPMGAVLSSTALFDAATLQWRKEAPLPAPREGHSMTVLKDGSVLVTGGSDGVSSTATAWTWRPGDAVWRNETAMSASRTSHSATLLPNGRVLIAGGLTATGAAVPTAQTYDPVGRSWFANGSMNSARGRHAAVLMPSNYVLLAGGVDGATNHISTELYDPTSNRFFQSTSLQVVRGAPHFIRLADWRVLIISKGDPTSDIFDEGRGTGAWAPWVGSNISLDGPSSQVTLSGLRFRGLSSASSGNWRASTSDFPLFTAVRDDGAVWRLSTTYFNATQATIQAPADLSPGTYHIFSAVNGTLSAAQPLSVGLRTGQSCLSSQQCLSLKCTGICEESIPGSVLDAGIQDGGVPDAGLPDAGPSDAGSQDAGAPDSGIPDGGITKGRSFGVGCSCSVTNDVFMWALAFGLVHRRRRAH